MYKKWAGIGWALVIGFALIAIVVGTLATERQRLIPTPTSGRAQTVAKQFDLTNREVTLLSSDGRITTTNTSDQTNYNHRGFILFVDVTGRDGSTTLTPTLHVKEPIGDNYITIWTAAAAIDSADTTIAYLFYPSTLTDAAELYTEAVDITLSRTWRAAFTHSDTDSITYTASCALIR